MGLFVKLEGETAILVCPGGIYKQADLYARDCLLYAKIGAGFIKLMYDKSTSSSRHRLDTLSWDGDSLWRTGTGAIATGEAPGWIPFKDQDWIRLGLPVPAAKPVAPVSTLAVNTKRQAKAQPRKKAA